MFSQLKKILKKTQTQFSNIKMSTQEAFSVMWDADRLDRCQHPTLKEPVFMVLQYLTRSWMSIAIYPVLDGILGS